ncbi:hypothetical protein A3F00_02795 [Candidatus Daviesbacteria bacterium RIFCSPHIGHO2_12_FULL_37_11]|uniref:Diacylglycerol kinase n=1 Tax=Candidatus Daviesbacteria bacterium RIFCSPHIGHO2_12_FULL_37_11 TaxID=1797777 RepID=A0A1F5K8Z2_9BACT|nr:MAG: hypothetical protein A2769_01900 [Candidatus Daviesbacteria bacterium RIFCSPHIGHO2_01_FULL_37_27]OGE37379.1 MAG: hypothetical protein A3F00_02795 [Candidatus Daviesbacteria bacterium RIFCSPHIGHO2_12_FULL_37_11]OGE45545.1 MAG: hypothetical protein A3B39_05030 [Candidatus Daviesbacteria bacterium RIFCSPLOWO2_01_FULL_37_10]
MVYHKRILSFKYALDGIGIAFKEEPNFKLHILIALAVILLSYLLKITRIEWMIVITLIGFVLSLELANKAIEEIIDSFTEEEHPKAKLAKDVSAGFVLVAAITSAAAGIIIFIPYIWTI